MRRWGEFKEVSPPSHRLYARAYWRFLLNWSYPPSRSDVPESVGATLRTLAKEEVLNYRKHAVECGGATIIDLTQPPPDPPPSKNKAA
jgi:hypothetical protein